MASEYRRLAVAHTLNTQLSSAHLARAQLCEELARAWATDNNLEITEKYVFTPTADNHPGSSIGSAGPPAPCT
jgi:hypothetical protein